MFDLYIHLTPDSVNIMKGELTKSLSHVKSSHRVEALARAFGFATYAALKAAVSSGAPLEKAVNWLSFRDYLKSKGFDVAATPLYLAAGRAAIRKVMEDAPRLTHHGIGLPPIRRKPDGTMETPEEHRQKFRESREELVYEVEQFLRAYAFVSCVGKIKSNNRHNSSYGLKHMAEKYPCSYPDGTKLGPSYVANGSLIAAALHAGFDCKEHYGSLNTTFNMSRKSLNELSEKIHKYREGKLAA